MKRFKLSALLASALLLLTACDVAVTDSNVNNVKATTVAGVSTEENRQISITVADVIAKNETVIYTDEISEETNKDNEVEVLPADKTPNIEVTVSNQTTLTQFDYNSIPAFSGTPYCVVNNNVPYFDEKEKTSTEPFETYSELDSLGRCGVAYANICKELMPTEKRGEIGSVKPTGWHSVKYDWVDGKYLYNRCHLIGFQLAGENANEMNLITGTRYMNVQGMLPFENMVDDYVEETGNHVLYRVTPIFVTDDELVVRGVLMEARSVEDDGDGIEFNVFCYNVQPDVVIDYATGESRASNQEEQEVVTEAQPEIPVEQPQEQETVAQEQNITVSYVLNTNTKKFHNPSCSSVKKMNESNKEYFEGNRDDVINRGYEPCKNCNP